MYKTIDKADIIWLYDCRLQRFIYYFPTFLDALKFLATEEVMWSQSSNIKRNEYLDNINMGKDKIFDGYKNPYWCSELNNYYHDGCIYNNRRYLFIDGKNRFIDFRIYSKEISVLVNSNALNYESLSRKINKSKKNNVKFRVDPIPNLWKYRKYADIRYVRTMNEKRLNSDIEIRNYVRAKRRKNNLPSIYDEIIRSSSRSWKDNSKKKYQWM